MTIDRIVTGGQTGADRGALDAAIDAGIDYGGWAPKGRLDESGVIPERYANLIEAGTEEPNVRTELNIRDSDAILILSHGPLFGGSEYTLETARKFGKPVIHLDLEILSMEAAAMAINAWLETYHPRVLNVAGPRASDDSIIYASTKEIIGRVLNQTAKAP